MSLTIDEVARELRCSPSTVRNYIAAGMLASINPVRPGCTRGRVFIEREAIESFKQQNTNGTATALAATVRHSPAASYREDLERLKQHGIS